VETLNNITDFNSKLSDICDRVYYRSPILWNELINRRDLTFQGAKARRELIQAMLEHQHEESHLITYPNSDTAVTHPTI
jgi:hypothetical protein